ncbi:hypothetical protein niasHS_004934 [Heterodera schachtii]|uniref:Uncharacterized protein n=1 Tax=Heterodera schachtii TaxID=97005 RepID=A0ABD2K089_HETSC
MICLFVSDEQQNEAVVGQQRKEEKQKQKNTDQHHHNHDHYQQQQQQKEQNHFESVAEQQIQNQPQGEEGDGDEECLANRAKLSRETVNKLRTERRRIVQSIPRTNRQQRELCRPDTGQNHVPYR